MTYQDLLPQIRQLPLNEKLLLLELLAHEVRTEVAPIAKKASPASKVLNEDKFSLADEVHGMLKPDGLMPSDAELKDMYIDALVEKYYK